MKIALPNPEFYFATFYVLAFAVTFALFIVFSIRRKIPLRSVLLMLTTVSLLTIIGSRLSIIPISAWSQVFRTGFTEKYTGRSAIGGLIFGLAGLMFSQKFFGIGKPIVDLYAWIAPIGFGIQKIGCFLNGCCYGRISDLPWSVQYPRGTDAHFHHWVNGMIDENAAFSLHVHPVQLYEAIFFITMAYIVWRTRNIWKKNGSILLFSLFLFFIFRFSIEFLRDPASSNFSNNSFLGVRLFQWFLLIFGFVCGLMLLVYEKYVRSAKKQSLIVEPSLNKSIAYVVAVSVLIFVIHGLFTPFEMISLDLKFIPAILLMAYHVFKSLTIVKFRLAATSFFILPLFLISQTFFPDSTRSFRSIKDFYQNGVKKYKRIDIGTSFGNIYNEVQYNPQHGQCGTTYTTEDYKHEFQMAGAGISVITKKEKLITTKGINLYGGTDKVINLTKQQENSDFLIGVNPYLKYDWNWIGIGMGVHVGNLRWIPQKPIDATTFDNGTWFSPIMPEGSLRLGRRDILDLKYAYGFNFPATFPLLINEFSVGSGFGNKSDFSFRYGLMVSKYNPFNQFFSAEGLVNKQIGLTLKYSFGHSDFNYINGSSMGYKSSQRIIFGVNYRFGFTK
ncbi:MAG: prolipoprotein diacylglyceryl transferase family protein [Bacteroidales bacterium]|jgi:phosphatidylglycerol:prolipoprotein diacylglycerol transferase